MLIMSVIMVAPKSVTAQTIQTLGVPTAPDQLPIGGDPGSIAVNTKTNKIYILSPADGTVIVLDSKSGAEKNIHVGIGTGFICRYCIGVDSMNNKIYVANSLSNTVSVIDGNSDTVKKTIPVGQRPTFVLVTWYIPYANVNLKISKYPSFVSPVLRHCCKIYVANTFNDTVSVIDGNTDTVKKTIPVGNCPSFILSGHFGTYVANEDTVSVIDGNTDTVKKTMTLFQPRLYMSCPVDPEPMVMYINDSEFKPAPTTLGPMYNYSETPTTNSTLMVLPGPGLYMNASRVQLSNGFVKQISLTLANQHTLEYGFLLNSEPPISLGWGDFLWTILSYYKYGLQNIPTKIYALNPYNGTVSIFSICDEYDIRAGCTVIQKHIIIGQGPGLMAVNDQTGILYIVYPRSGTVSVINGFTDKVAVGVILNVSPSDSGAIKCDGTIYPTNTYIYVDSGTTCTAQSNKGFEFNNWAQSPLTNRNSTTPIEASDHPEILRVDRYGIFTANFKLPHQLTTEDFVAYSTLITGVISAAVAINGALLVVPGWRRARNQRTHLRECIKMIDGDVGKSHRDTIEDKIFGYYVDGKLSEDHRQLLKDKISEYYGSSESGT
jgi:YVTN family beta-propeller protein